MTADGAPLRLDAHVGKGGPFDRPADDLLGARLYAGELGSPVAVIRRSAIEHNAATMAAYVAAAGVVLAPHAKTSMSPELCRLQLARGAWGMTAAVPWQAARIWEWGISRVLVANEITDSRGLVGLLRRRDVEAGRELWWYVDDPIGVAIAADAVRRAGVEHAEVLVEIGHADGRTGVRSVGAAVELADQVRATPELRLAGVAGYEGTITWSRDAEPLGRVDAYLSTLGAAAEQIASTVGFEVGAPIVTAGGSSFFERVVSILGPIAAAVGGSLVLRSGCYLTHDHGVYDRLSPASQSAWDRPRFEGAIEVWGHVVSRPEPGLALVNAGRRDVSFDSGLPVPIAWSTGDGLRRSLAPSDGWTVSALGDQHAFVRLPDAAPLRPGDLVGLGISHPCTTFDKWGRFFLVDDDGVVTGVVTTEFD